MSADTFRRSDRFRTALQAFDRANGEDPNRESDETHREWPKEVI